MTRFRMTMVALAMLVGSTGCYYDQLQQSQRALRTQTQAREEAQRDLDDARQMNKQKDTQIEALQNQNDTKDRTIGSMTAENEGLRNALAEAQGIAKEMAGKQLGGLTIINRQLPPEVDAALRKFAEQYPDIVDFLGNSVRWKSDLLFPLGSDQMTVSERVQEALRKFAEIVKSPAAQGLELVIVGHTDTTRIAKPETLREHKSNWHLSTHRAIAVMRILGDLGVQEPRMGVMGYGELRPIADNSTPEGKARNRRVEIYLVPKGSITGTGTPGVSKSEETGPFVKPSELSAPEHAAPAARPTGTRTGRPGAKAPSPAAPKAREKATEEPVIPPPPPGNESETPAEK